MDLREQDRYAQQYVITLFATPQRFGLNDRDLQAFIAPLALSQNAQLREFVRGRQRLFELGSTSVELKGPTLTGQSFDLQDLRGKIVLVDYWATSCSSCIQAFPRIKDIYGRYKARGFEVVSVCADAIANKRLVEKVEREVGLDWTTLAVDEQWPELSQRYGYTSVPQYMLLDRAGKLVAGTSEVDMGRNLETLLIRMLVEEESSVSAR
jgi:thiol-disulfide isomerase/thioredoxin